MQKIISGLEGLFVVVVVVVLVFCVRNLMSKSTPTTGPGDVKPDVPVEKIEGEPKKQPLGPLPKEEEERAMVRNIAPSGKGKEVKEGVSTGYTDVRMKVSVSIE